MRHYRIAGAKRLNQRGVDAAHLMAMHIGRAVKAQRLHNFKQRIFRLGPRNDGLKAAGIHHVFINHIPQETCCAAM